MKRLYCFTAGLLLLTVRAEKEDFQGFLTKQTKGTPVREDLLLRRENTIGHGTEAIPQENSHQHTAVALTAKILAELFDTKPTHPYKTTQNTKQPTMTAIQNGEHLAVKNGKNNFPLTSDNPSAMRIHGSDGPLISNNEKIVLTSIQAVFESIMQGTFKPKVSLSANTEKTSYWQLDNRNQRHTDPVTLTSADGEPAAPILSTSHPRVIDNLAAPRNDDDDKRSQGEDEKGISNLGGNEDTSGVMQSFFRGETRRDPLRGNIGTSLCLTCQEEQTASTERSAAVPALSPDGSSNSLRTQGPALDFNQVTASLNLQLARGQKEKQNKVISHQDITSHSSFAQSETVVPLNLTVNNSNLNDSLSDTRTAAFQAQSLAEMSPVMQDEIRKQSRETHSREISVTNRPNSTITVLQGPSKSHSTLMTLLKNEDKEMFGSISSQLSNKSIKKNASHGLSAMFEILFQHIEPLTFSSGSTSSKTAITEGPDSRRGRGVLAVDNDNGSTSHPTATKTSINGYSEVSLSGITTVRVSHALTSRADFLLSVLRSQSTAKLKPQTKQPMIMSLSQKDSASMRQLIHELVSQKLNTLKSGTKHTEVSVMKNLIPTSTTAKVEITSKLHLSQPRPDELMPAQTVQTSTPFSERLTTMRFSPVVYNGKPGGVNEQVMNADEDSKSNETKEMLDLKEEETAKDDDKFGNKMEDLLLSDQMENERQEKTITSDVEINQNTALEADKMDKLQARPIGKKSEMEQSEDVRQNIDETGAREIDVTEINAPTSAEERRESLLKEGAKETADKEDLKHKEEAEREGRTNAPLGPGTNSFAVSSDIGHAVISQMSDLRAPKLSSEISFSKETSTHIQSEISNNGSTFSKVEEGVRKEVSKLGFSTTATANTSTRHSETYRVSTSTIPAHISTHKSASFVPQSISDMLTFTTIGFPQAQVKEESFRKEGEEETTDEKDLKHEGGIGREDRKSVPLVLDGNSEEVSSDKGHPVTSLSDHHGLIIQLGVTEQKNVHLSAQMNKLGLLHSTLRSLGPKPSSVTSIPFQFHPHKTKNHGSSSLSEEIDKKNVEALFSVTASPKTLPKLHKTFEGSTSSVLSQISTHESFPTVPSSVSNMLSITTLGFLQTQKQGEGKMADMKDLMSYPSESTNHGSTFSPAEENAKKNDADTSFSPKPSPKTLPSYLQIFGSRTSTTLSHISQHRSHFTTVPNSFSNVLSITPLGFLQAQEQNEFIKKEGDGKMAIKADLKQNKNIWRQGRTNAPLGLVVNSVEVSTDKGHPVTRLSDHRLIKQLGVTEQKSIDPSDLFFNKVAGNLEQLHSTVLSPSPRPSGMTSSPIQAHPSETANHGSSSSPEERPKKEVEALFSLAAARENLPKLQKMFEGSTTTIPPHINPHRSIPPVPNSIAYMSRDISGFLRVKDQNESLKKEGKETSDKEEGRITAPPGADANSTKVSSDKEHPVSCLSNHHSLMELEEGTEQKSVHLSAQIRSEAFYDKVTGTDEQHHLTLTSQRPKILIMTSIPIHHNLSEATNHESTFLPAKDSAKKEVVEASFLPTKTSKLLQIFGITSPTIIPQSKLAPPSLNSVSSMLSVTAKGILRAQPHSTVSSPSLHPSIIQSFLDERQDFRASVLNENLILTHTRESTERSSQENTDKSSVLVALTSKVSESMPVMLNDFPSRPPTAAAKMTAGQFQPHQGQPAPKTTPSASSDMISGQPCSLKLSEQEADSDHFHSPVNNNEQRSVQAQMSAMSPKARSNQFPLSGASPLLNPELFGSDSIYITSGLEGLTGSTTGRHVGYGNRGGGSLLVDSDEANQAEENDSQQPQKTFVDLSTKAEIKDQSNADEFLSLSLKQTEKLAVKHTNGSNHDDLFSKSNDKGNNTASKSNHLFQLSYNGTSFESTSMKEQAINENFVPVMKDTAPPVHDSNDQTDNAGDSMPEIPIILANDASKNTMSDFQHLTGGGIGVEHDPSTSHSLVGEATRTTPHINFSKDFIIPIKSTQQPPDQIMTAGTEFQITTTKLIDSFSVPLADHMGSHILSQEAHESALTTIERGRVVAEESSERRLQTNNQIEPTPGNLTLAVKRENMIETRNLEQPEREISIQNIERAQHAQPGEIEITRPFNIPQQGVRADLFNSAGEAHSTTPTVGKRVRYSTFNKVKTLMMTRSTFRTTHPPLDVKDHLMKHVLPEKTSISPIDIEAVSDMGTFVRRGPTEINNKSSCGAIDCAESVKRSKTDEFDHLPGKILKAQAAYMQTDLLNTSGTPAMAPESSNCSTNSPLPGNATPQATVPVHADLSSASSKSDHSHAPVDEIMTQKINSLTHKTPTKTQQLATERALFERKRILEWSAKTASRNSHSEAAKVTLSELEASTAEVTEQILPTVKNTITQLNRKAGEEILEAQKASRSALSSSKGEAALTESVRRSLLPEPASDSELLRVKSRGGSPHLHLSGVTEVSDDLCGSGNYTAEMTLSLGRDLEPGDAVPALGNLRVIINLKTNNSRLNLGVTSCCLSPTIRPDLSNATCCLFSRLAAEPAGITLLPAALPTSASFTISLFQMINYSLAYLHCDLSVCPRNRSGCERQCLQQRSVAPTEGPRAVVANLRNRISFGPVLKEVKNSTFPQEIDPSELDLVLVIVSLVVASSVVTVTLLLVWLTYRHRAIWPLRSAAPPGTRRCCCCCRLRPGGDLILP